jgi:hypothetical protein
MDDMHDFVIKTRRTQAKVLQNYKKENVGNTVQKQAQSRKYQRVKPSGDQTYGR